MNVLLTIVLAVQMLTALAMIGLILLQHGKGADMGAAFGSGASGSLFGATGSANFLSRTTAVLAGGVLRLHAGAGLLRPQLRPAGAAAACWSAPPSRRAAPAAPALQRRSRRLQPRAAAPAGHGAAGAGLRRRRRSRRSSTSDRSAAVSESGCSFGVNSAVRKADNPLQRFLDAVRAASKHADVVKLVDTLS